MTPERRAARFWLTSTLLTLAGVGGATPFTSERYGFSFTPPEGWTYAKLPGFAAEVFVAPGAAGRFRPNINVLEPIPTQDMNHADVCEQNARGIEAAISAAKVTRQRYNARTDVCELTYRGRPNGQDLQFYAELRFGQQGYHTLTFTADPVNFAKLLLQVQASFATFKPQPRAAFTANS